MNFHKEQRTIISANKLADLLFLPENPSQIGLLFLHGGGSAAKERYEDIQEFLAQEGFTSLSFDFRGVGQSEGSFIDGTLNNRLEDAKKAYEELKKYTSKIIVVGCSMGGHVATRLTEIEDVYGLILLYAAAYAKEAEDKKLNEEFTKILHAQNSWENSPAFTAVSKFQGKILVIYGEKDTIIPKEIQNKYKELIASKGNFLLLANAQHLFLNPKDQYEEQAKQTAIGQILLFLKQLLIAE